MGIGAWLAQAIASAVASASNATKPGAGALPAGVVDLRKQAGRGPVYGKRKWSGVTGVTLHQTACLMGERPERWYNTGCHIGVTRSGKILWLHDFTDLVVHGNGWNTQCVGIEIDGLYAGIQGNQRTVWNDPDTGWREQGMDILLEQMEAVKRAVRWIVETVRGNGGKVKALVAHRQSSDTRDSDPGSGIWQAVALPLLKELELTDGGPGFVIGRGKPIPEAWDPSRKGIRY